MTTQVLLQRTHKMIKSLFPLGKPPIFGLKKNTMNAINGFAMAKKQNINNKTISITKEMLIINFHCLETPKRNFEITQIKQFLPNINICDKNKRTTLWKIIYRKNVCIDDDTKDLWQIIIQKYMVMNSKLKNWINNSHHPDKIYTILSPTT